MAMTVGANREPMPHHRGGAGSEMLLRRRVIPAVGTMLVAIATSLWAPEAVAREAPDADADVGSNLRLLPVPIFITEPSIGQGLGVSLMVIHPRSEGRKALAHVEMPDTRIEVSDGNRRPPDVTAVFGAVTDGDLVQFESQAPLLAGGIGGRYLFADDLGLWVGVDVVRGTEDYVGYIQVGHAWWSS